MVRGVTKSQIQLSDFHFSLGRTAAKAQGRGTPPGLGWL